MSEEQNLRAAKQTKWFDNFIPKVSQTFLGSYIACNSIKAKDLEKQIAISQKQYWDYIINIISQYQQIQIEIFNAVTSKLLENLKLIVDDNDPVINKLAEFKINNNMFPKNCVIAISDTHGDIASIIGVLISIGMFSFTGKFVWFDLETNEIIYEPSEINVKFNRYVLLPELVPNENCDITFLHLGDYIDRGWESIQSLALLKYINEIKGNLGIHFLAGNHEISYNADDGISRYHNQLKNLNCLEASYILPKGNNKYICYSHCQLTKQALNIMFIMVHDLLGFEETRSETEFRDLQKIFQELISKNQDLKNKLESFFKNNSGIDFASFVLKWVEFYEILISNGFQDIDFFYIRNIIIDMFIKFYSTRSDLSNDFDEFCNKIWPGFRSGSGPFYIASRNSVDKRYLFDDVEQVVGHTPNDSICIKENVTFIDNGRGCVVDVREQTKFSYYVSLSNGNTIFTSFAAPRIGKNGLLLFNENSEINQENIEILGSPLDIIKMYVPEFEWTDIHFKENFINSINDFCKAFGCDEFDSENIIKECEDNANKFLQDFLRKNNGVKQIKIDCLKNDKQNRNSDTSKISNKLSWLLGIFFTVVPIAVGITLGAISILVWPFASIIISAGIVAGIIFGVVKCCKKARNTNNFYKINSISEQNSNSMGKSLCARGDNALSQSNELNGEQLQSLLPNSGQYK